MKTYLITGGLGFIGSNYIQYLLNSVPDASIINVDCLTYAGNPQNLEQVCHNKRYKFVMANICDLSAMQRIFRENSIDYIVNFAAESHVDRSIETPEIFAQTNILGTLNLLNLANHHWKTENGYRNGVKFLQISTDEVYGSLGTTGYFSETTPLAPHSPYSASKAAADMFVQAFFDTYNLPINITRCSNNYGAYQFPEKLIPVIIENALAHKSIPVYGDGLNVRDWLHVNDHCRAIQIVIEHGKIGEVYNIGGNNEIANINIVKLILQYLHDNADPIISDDLITFVTDRKGHDRRYAIDASKIKLHLGWMPEISFKNGMIETINWYINNRKWIESIRNGSYQNLDN